MKISAKGRYALASTVYMAACYGGGEYITVISISEKLGISKIYLEQVFSLLKRGDVVNSVKGAQGGYRLSRPPSEITAYDVLSAVETSLFEKAEDTVLDCVPEIEEAVKELVFERADSVLAAALGNATLAMLAGNAEKRKANTGNMFYI